MSLDGVARRCGSTVTNYRATLPEAQAADGSRILSWIAIATNVRIIFEPITSALAERLWGHETKATMRALVPRPIGSPRVRDGIVVTAGHFSGLRYRVVESIPHELAPGSAHAELGLELTSEAIP